MATYKLEIKSKYGKLQKALFPASQSPPPFKDDDTFDSVQALLESLDKQVEPLDFDDEDSVIFRGIAYTSYGALKRIVRDATY